MGAVHLQGLRLSRELRAQSVAGRTRRLEEFAYTAPLRVPEGKKKNNGTLNPELRTPLRIIMLLPYRNYIIGPTAYRTAVYCVIRRVRPTNSKFRVSCSRTLYGW